LSDDWTGGAEHVHGDTVEQSLVSVLTDSPATLLLVENVDVDEPVYIGAAYTDERSDDKTPIGLAHVETPVPAPRCSSRIKTKPK